LLASQEEQNMGEKPKVDSDPEQGAAPLEKPRQETVGPVPTDEPTALPKKNDNVR
jgi:hypothetical protein